MPRTGHRWHNAPMEAEHQQERQRRTARGPRSQAEREAVALEIAFALISGGVIAGLAFLAVAAPALFGDASNTWLLAGQWAGSWVFILRVLWVLLKWQQALRTTVGQPGRPGRTSPDS
jgi:hypothetical protein